MNNTQKLRYYIASHTNKIGLNQNCQIKKCLPGLPVLRSICQTMSGCVSVCFFNADSTYTLLVDTVHAIFDRILKRCLLTFHVVVTFTTVLLSANVNVITPIKSNQKG